MPPTTVSQLQAYTSPWLKASDLQGRPATVTIEKTTVEQVRQQDGAKEDRIVVAFRGKAKRLICNKTQALTLAALAKTEVFANWSGLTVVLEPATTRSGKETINIRQPPSTRSSTEQVKPKPPIIDDDNPFDDEDDHGMPGPKGIADSMVRGPGYAG